MPFSKIGKFTENKSTIVKMMMALILLVVPIITVAWVVFDWSSVNSTQAAVGINQQITYQGKLANAAGVSVSSGDYGFQFQLYDSASGGNLLWTETWTATTTAGAVSIASGIFSANLGTSTSLSSVDFNADTLYLQVYFDSDNSGSFEETFSPRKRITSSPYAFNSNTVDGLHATTTATAGQLLALDANKGLTLNSVTTTDSFYATGYASTTLGFFTQGNLWVGGNATSSHLAVSELCLSGDCQVSWPSSSDSGSSGAWAAFDATALTPTSTRGILINTASSTITHLTINTATTSNWLNIGTYDVIANFGSNIGAGDLYVGRNATTTGNLTVTGQTNLSSASTTGSLYVGGYASSTLGLFTQSDLHVGGASTFDGLLSGSGWTTSQQNWWNATTTWAGSQSEFNKYLNATTTLDLTTFFSTQATTTYLYSSSLGLNSEYFTDLTGTNLVNTAGVLNITTAPTLTGTNLTGIPAASILAGTFGTGSYTFDTNLTVGGFASSTTGLFTQSDLHVGGATTFDGLLSGSGWTTSQQNWWNATTTWAGSQSEFNKYLNATTTLDLTTFFSTQATTTYLYSSSLGLNSEYFTDLTGTNLVNTAGVLNITTAPTLTGTNITGIPAAAILAGTFGTGSYTFDTNLTVGGYASSTTGLFTQSNGHYGGNLRVDGSATTTGRLNAVGGVFVGDDDISKGIVKVYGDSGANGGELHLFYGATRDDTYQYWTMQPADDASKDTLEFGTNLNERLFLFTAAGNLTMTGDLSVAGQATTSDWLNIGTTDVVGLLGSNIGAGDLYVGRNATTTGNLTVGGFASSTSLYVGIDGQTSTSTQIRGGLLVDSTTLVVNANENRVGIGMASPSTLLHVYGGSAGAGSAPYTNTDLTVEDNDTVRMQFLAPNNKTIDLLFGDQDSSLPGQISWDNATNIFTFSASAGSNPMVLNSSGYVGIGDITPLSLFTVGDGDKFQIDASGNATSSGWFNVGTTDVVGLLGSNIGAGDLYVGRNATTTGNLTVASSTAMTTGPGPAMFVNSFDNKVGIGTANPTSLLELSNTRGSLNIEIDISNTTSKNGCIVNKVGGSSVMAYGFVQTATNGTGREFQIVNGGDCDTNELFVVEQGGRVGIGETSPNSDLEITSSTDILYSTGGTGTLPNEGTVLSLNNAHDDANFVGIHFDVDNSSINTGDLVYVKKTAGAFYDAKFAFRARDTINSYKELFTIDNLGNASTTGDLTALGVYSDTTASAANVFIDSTGKFWRSTSGRKYKTDIDYNGVDGSLVYDLQPASYKDIGSGVEYIGFVAEDVATIEPRLVLYDPQGNPDALHYGQFTALIVAGLKNLKTEVDNLKVNVNQNSYSNENYSLSVNDNSNINLQTLVVQQAATFYGTITVRGEANFEVKVTFNDHITVDDDTAGTAILLAGATSTEVIFNKEYDNIPKVVVSLNTLIDVNYAVTKKTAKSFRISLLNVINQDIEFDWLALAVKNDNNTNQPTPQVAGESTIAGCMDASANNYNPLANEDDGSCTYPVVAPAPVPVSTLVPVPEPTPTPQPEADPPLAETPEPIPVVEPVIQPELTPEPVVEPEPTPTLEPVVEPTPEPESEPESIPTVPVE